MQGEPKTMFNLLSLNRTAADFVSLHIVQTVMMTTSFLHLDLPIDLRDYNPTASELSARNLDICNPGFNKLIPSEFRLAQ